MADKPSTYASDVVISLGLATMRGKLRTIRNKEKADSFRTLCPACQGNGEAVPVEQRFTCANDHGPFLPAECTGKGKQAGDALVAFTAEELEALGADTSDHKRMDLHIHPADQVAHLRPTGISYFFDPGMPDRLVGVLMELLERSDRAFMGLMTLRGARYLFRLQAARHGIELVGMTRPEELFAFGEADHPYSTAELDFGFQLAEALVTDFDAEAYRSDTAAKVAALLAAKTGDGTATVTPLPAPLPTANDLENALAASLAAAKAQKEAA